MFRDREKELDRLNRKLLEDEEEETEQQEYEEYKDREQPDYDAYNGDTADVDMEDYSEQVYNEPKRSGCAVAVFLLLCAAILLIFAYVLAKKEGLI